MKAKTRTDIPPETAARCLFLSDRTCCVCRMRGKPVQIHHLDGDSSNHSMQNLAVLCLECHHETQLRGGFDRKLDPDQISLYRDDWRRIVARQRAAAQEHQIATSGNVSLQLELATSIAEIYRETEQYELLAMHYHAIGNDELRDKYVEVALQQSPTDDAICYLRGLQGKTELIPQDVLLRREARYTRNKDWSQRARFYEKLGRYPEAIADYLRTVSESLEQRSIFSAAFYLKELAESDLVTELFVIALRQATEEGSLWWQVRALDELGWRDEERQLVLDHAKEIEESGDLLLLQRLAAAQGKQREYLDLREQIARGQRVLPGGRVEFPKARQQ